MSYHISMRLAIMQDDRQIKLASEGELRYQSVALHVAGREIAVVIQTNLANGDDTRRMRQLTFGGQRLVGERRGVMRMSANAGKDAIRICRRQGNGCLARL